MRIKRVISVVAAVCMMLTSVLWGELSVGAVDRKDAWTTLRRADELDTEDGLYKPAPGFQYTADGFTTIPADYTNTTPYVNVQTKEAQNIRDGIYMEMRIDAFSYGGDHMADHWVAFHISDTPNILPGETDYNNNFLALARGDGDGEADVQSFIAVAETEQNIGQFMHYGDVTATIPVDDEGREIYTFELTWDGSAYDIKICGTSVAGMASVTDYLNRFNADGDFYMGISLHSGVKGGEASVTILKYGTSKANATVPEGSESKEPEENPYAPSAPILDPSSVAYGQPSILYNAETCPEPGSGNMELTLTDEGFYHIRALESNVYMTMRPPKRISYSAQDFPVIGVMLRNCWASSGAVWPFAGDIMTPDGDYFGAWSPWDSAGIYGADEEYAFCIIDLTELWPEGRINGIRLDFLNIDDADREFDVCWVGHFRSAEEAIAYNEAWVDEQGIDSVEVTTEDTDDETDAPPDVETAAPESDTAGDLSDTETVPVPEPETSTGVADSQHAQSKVVGSVLKMLTLLVLAACAIGLVMILAALPGALYWRHKQTKQWK